MMLPTYDGTLADYRLQGTPIAPRPPQHAFNRIAFAAAHVVSDPLAERAPWQPPPAIDWDQTMAFRTFLWDQGLHLAEAMDTSQRGMGVDWPTARELIRRTMTGAKAHPMKPRVACGAGTDQTPISELTREADIVAAYTEQMEAIEAAGGQCIIMASKAMAAAFDSPEPYQRIYGHLISQAQEPVILHWLGDMFDPKLAGYWGCKTADEASGIVLGIIEENSDQVDGIKISLLDQEFEEKFRSRLPDGVRLYTGDDFNYASLIEGDGTHHSDALLGIFAAISPAAAQSLEALAAGDTDSFRSLLDVTVPLSREIFKSPTRYYKAGVAFLAWLNGLQSHFVMPGGMQSAREITHYAEVFRLADQAGLIWQIDTAEGRMRDLLRLHGIED